MLKIYNEKEVGKDLYLKLEQGVGCINLIVVEKDGKFVANGILITINTNNKKVYACSGINKILGFDLYEDQKLKIE